MADFARSAHPGVQAQLDRLSKLSPAGDRLGLERIGAVLERLGRPQDQLPPVFHVAGTNGKGSTVRLPARSDRGRRLFRSRLHQPASRPLQRAYSRRRPTD